MRTVEVNDAVVKALNRSMSADHPEIMINLLRYREHADYGDRTDVTPCSGRQAYRRFSQAALPCVQRVGGRVCWSGPILGRVLCPEDQRWDTLFLVEYLSFTCPPRIYSDPEFQSIMCHRTAAPEDSRLIATRTVIRQGISAMPKAIEIQ
ncbi:hypothetical protein Sj15T_12550 [Sphingobium sp. TA15]|uniref:DUF1330 domain-containing protein n=1 Tax=Sphingobium indicum (strain DSM 16413 / CCM 7287 / MTCC 6362 / UT26 / NBRC 101211 / UT26S) TaxID=452662 RepID=D4Z2G5_SPHIU|nr:hypothetical protein [Sphingobium indicum]BAI96797.1 hypothetical protein SJA_C1-19630 [Sphingobium indicum UT26S]BDD66234.1 hypothetical protein Sj15T_12550 [Sphingobium sp. TA15]